VRGSVNTTSDPVIVGVDNTDHNDHTIGAAFEEAARRNCAVIAIHAHEPPAAYGVTAMSILPFSPKDLCQATPA
jgi:hypothetical protein